MNITFPLHLLRDKERGLLLHCSQCDELAIAWISRVPFCKEHLHLRWYMTITQEEGRS